MSNKEESGTELIAFCKKLVVISIQLFFLLRWARSHVANAILDISNTISLTDSIRAIFDTMLSLYWLSLPSRKDHVQSNRFEIVARQKSEECRVDEYVGHGILRRTAQNSNAVVCCAHKLWTHWTHYDIGPRSDVDLLNMFSITSRSSVNILVTFWNSIKVRRKNNQHVIKINSRPTVNTLLWNKVKVSGGHIEHVLK
jgi:hypothetical protein